MMIELQESTCPGSRENQRDWNPSDIHQHTEWTAETIATIVIAGEAAGTRASRVRRCNCCAIRSVRSVVRLTVHFLEQSLDPDSVSPLPPPSLNIVAQCFT